MALTSSFQPSSTPNYHKDLLDSSRHHRRHHRKKNKPPPPPPPPSKTMATSSWEQFKSLLSCRSAAAIPSQVHDPSRKSPIKTNNHGRLIGPSTSTLTCGSSICAIRDIVHGNTRVVHRSDSADRSSLGGGDSVVTSDTVPLTGRRGAAAAHGSQSLPSRGGMPLRRLSGCYECHSIDAEPASRRYPRPRTLCACTECGEVFTKPESLELHQTMRHAVSELAPDDSGRNIVEIIFKSSWQKKDLPPCRIDRILRVHNTPRTISRFEDHRSAVKSRATAAAAALPHPPKKNPRCAADGNELLRFHSTSLSCPLGANGSASLCSAAATGSCGVCAVIRHGFPRGTHVCTTASSGRAHDCGTNSASADGQRRRAMLVCRVIAGRVRRTGDDSDEYDSVAGEEGAYGDLEELFVASPRAILPCFVVIYRVLE